MQTQSNESPVDTGSVTSKPSYRLNSILLTLLTIALVVVPLGTCTLANSAADEDEDFPELFDRLDYFLENFYLDLDRAEPRFLFERALSSLENAADEIYVENSVSTDPFVEVHVGNQFKVYSLNRVTSLKTAFDYLEEIFEFISRTYEGKTPINEIRYAAANGFLTGLDPHTLVFSPKAFKEFYIHIEGEIYGVGMLVGVRKGRLHVIQVLKDTPASAAGFKNGDIITKIGEESTINMTVTEAVDKIRGPKGEEVVLTVKRRESKENNKLTTLSIPVARDRVVIKSVESKLLPGGMGYIDVRNFDKKTVGSLQSHLTRLYEQNNSKEVSGLILDLRRNSGGLLKQASEMSDLFLANGELYSIADKNGVTGHAAADDGDEPRFPMVILCSEASASGAEIVIGALQQNNRALVLGNTTFGKGSVQQLHSLVRRRLPTESDPQLKITVSEYLIPGRISIQEDGVVPDILAQRVVFSEKEISLFPDERHGTEKDYDHHIVSKFARKQKPSETIQYPYIFEPEEEEFGDPFMGGEIKPLEDALVKIAMELLKLSEGPSFKRDQFLASNREGIDRIRKDQLKQIVGLLKERGIDWTEGKNLATRDLELQISHEFEERPSGDEDDPYPERFLEITARLTNRSPHTLYRVAGISESDHYLYNEREFLFGKLAPGETVERSLEITVFPSSATRSDLLTIEVTAPGIDSVLTQRTQEIVVDGEDLPQFSYSLTMNDTDTGVPIRKLSPGMSVQAVAKVKNVGRRTLKKGVVILRNKKAVKEIFLEKGRIEISDLEPGETREVAFKFKVQPNSKMDSYEFEFGVADSYYPTSLSRNFEVPAVDTPGPGFVNGEWSQAPEISVKVSLDDKEVTEGKDEKGVIVTDRDKVFLSTQIRDERLAFNSWISTASLGLHENGESDKIFFAKSEPEKNSHRANLKTTVPLKVGQNLVAVVAKNELGFVQRRIFFVRRTPVATVSTEGAEKPAPTDPK